MHPICHIIVIIVFQSTLPARGSDEQYIYATADGITISIHAPREGERRSGRAALSIAAHISIHAPREGERRLQAFVPHRWCKNFNPRSPRGGATRDMTAEEIAEFISIHAPREGERR